MKKQLLIEVDCGEVTCQECDFYNRKGEACEMFQTSLVDDCVRDPRCINAEQKARDLRFGWKHKEETNDEMLERTDRIMRDARLDEAMPDPGPAERLARGGYGSDRPEVEER